MRSYCIERLETHTERRRKQEKKRQKRKKVSGRIAAKGRNTWDVCAY